MRTTSSVSVLVIVMVAMWASEYAESAPRQASAPAMDCSTLILNMADCLSFVINGSTVAKPEGTCCNGLKTVLKVDSACLCETFRSSAQLGIVLNVTKAFTLADACKVSSPVDTYCPPTAETPAPALSPVSSPLASDSAAAPPSLTVEANKVPPAPFSGTSSSGSSAMSVSVGSLATGLAVLSFFSF